MISRPMLVAVSRRPDLWVEALRAMLAVAPRAWWRRRPFLPLPDPAYASWRVATARGDPSAELSGQELLLYLEWRKRQHGVLRRI